MPEPALLLIENGDLFTPRPEGRGSVLCAAGTILRTGDIPRAPLAQSGLALEVIDAAGCIVVPGLIDPHEHLIGGSGERGFHSQTPEIFLRELIQGGITTVVGCLGTDTVTRNMPALLAKVKGLRAQRLTAFLYTGGYDVPPATLTGCPRRDILFIEEVIGIGETAIADRRGSQPSLAELARLASLAYTGGTLSGKAGVLHFHTGEHESRLSLLRCLLDQYPVEPATLYPTHVERNEELFAEAVSLTRRGVTVDIDVMENDMAHWVRRYAELNGAPGKLTASSDAAIAPPSSLLAQVRECVLGDRLPLAEILPLVTSNTAAVLKFARKGVLAPAMDADLLVLDRDSLAIRDVVAGGRVLMRNRALTVQEEFLNTSQRRIHLIAEQ